MEEKNAEKEVATAATETKTEVESEKKEETTEVKDESKSETSQDIDFKKELEELEKRETPKPGERDKAKYTVGKILERFPDLKEEITPTTPADKDLATVLVRNQVEGIIRQKVHEAGIKDEANAVAYYMKHYDRLPKTGNIYDDADDAIWHADKPRIKNAIAEMKRKPPEPGFASAPGQRPPVSTAPELPPDELKHLPQGMKQVAPGKYESDISILEWNKSVGQWEHKLKPRTE